MNFCSYCTVSAWVLTPPRKLQSSNFLCPVPQVLKNLISPPRQTKSSDSFNMLLMFNNTIYTDFKTANKHILIPIHVIQVF